MPLNKLERQELLKKIIISSTFVVAPMVEQSELAWRLLSRKFGADLTFTPMFHAKQFLQSEKYRKEYFKHHVDDYPLIVQFCANDADAFVNAAKLVQDNCVAVDLNLGCPQHIAKRGNYGSFLQDDWETITKIVSKANAELEVPITCKIRIFKDPKRTVEYAKMLVAAGAQVLTVHGRLREQKGHLTGIADWTQIKRVKESVNVPVIANGNILYHEDIQRCFNETGVDAVMSAEGNLYNPAISTSEMYASWHLADEYFRVIDQYSESANHAQAKAHIFKLYHKW
jgi:tRNA-dihydrouridine synthase 1